MEPFTLLLILHIAGGASGLLCGGFVLVTKKGTGRHRLVGTVYYGSMLCAAFSALVLSVLHPNYFLFIVGVFSAFLVVTGRRYARYRISRRFGYADWAISATMLLFSLGFLAFGTSLLLRSETFGTVMLVFGLISLLMVFQDYRNYTGKTGIPNFWLTTHLQRMVGGYIASTTAFLVVNNTLLPPVVAWLLPTAILTPLIFVWTKKYRAKKPAVA